MNTVTPAELTERFATWAAHHSSSMTPEDAAVRQEFMQRFPLAKLRELPLEKYAMGHGDQDNLSYWLEHKTKYLGSILGGDARKFGVYWSSKQNQYVVNSMFSDAEDARRRVLGAIADSAELLREGQTAQADQAAASMGENRYSMRLKPLFLYFPELLLPISSPTHLQHFLRLFGQEPSGDQMAMNQQLLAFLRSIPTMRDADTVGLMRFLYDCYPFDPEPRRVWKVALGEQSQYLPEALEHGAVFIGSHIEDLQAVPEKQMPAQLAAAGDEAGFASSAIAFAHRMQVGDVVIVNHGMSRVVAVGLVEGPYLKPSAVTNPLTSEVLADRHPLWAHARPVDWLLKTAVDLPAGVTRLAIKTVSPLPEESLQHILDAYAAQDSSPEQLDRLRLLGWQGTVKPARPALVDDLIKVAGHTRNIILYGPPGTGKTYMAREFARAWVRNSLPLSASTSSAFKPRHWWQAVALALADLGAASVPELQRHAVIHSFLSTRANNHLTQTLWQQLLSHTDPSDPSSNMERRTPPYLFTRSHPGRDEGRWQLNDEGEVLVQQWLQPAVNGAATDDPLQGLLERVTFHPAFTYEEFVEGLRPTQSGGFEVRDGVFKRLCQRAHANPEQQFVLLIDEINRADTSKTFGELITLVEDDKRATPGTSGEHAVTLPYSDPPVNQLSVPDNLWIIGTMNTADRSITLMDVALRRRFAFVELPPQPELLSGKVGTTNLSPERLLRTLNREIIRRIDKDHQIGHAYLMAGDLSPSTLSFRWRHQIVPLLQEYFYAREADLEAMLGKSLYEDAMGINRFEHEDALIYALLQFTETTAT